MSAIAEHWKGTSLQNGEKILISSSFRKSVLLLEHFNPSCSVLSCTLHYLAATFKGQGLRLHGREISEFESWDSCLTFHCSQKSGLVIPQWINSLKIKSLHICIGCMQLILSLNLAALFHYI
jgi:hypothetical protein